jgi:hypothetical protein
METAVSTYRIVRVVDWSAKPKRNATRPYRPPDFDEWVAKAQEALNILVRSVTRKLTKPEQAIVDAFMKMDTDCPKDKYIARKEPKLDAINAATNASFYKLVKSQ